MSTTITQTSVTTQDITASGTATLATQIHPLVTKGVNYPALMTDEIILLSATGLTVTLPTAVGCAGKRFLVKLTASGTGTVATTGGQNIDAATPYTLSAQYKFVDLVSDGVQWWIIAAN